MRFCRLSLVLLGFASRGLSQEIQPPQFVPFTGPTVAYPETGIMLSVLAMEGSGGSDFDYELLAAPPDTLCLSFFGRPDEQFLLLDWKTPPRSLVGTTNQFVIKITDHGTPPLSATNVMSFVLLDFPPIRSIAKTNGMIVLQIADLLPDMDYSLQWAEAVPSTNWAELTRLSPTAPSMAVTDTHPPAAQRFYQLRPYGWRYGFGLP